MTFLSGTFVNDGNDPAWTLAQGNGERTYTRRIDFASAFGNVPMVVVSLSGMDIGSGPAKLYSGSTEIDAQGFTLVLKTWGETKVWATVVNWIAIGL